MELTATPTRGEVIVVGTTDVRRARLHFPKESARFPRAETGYFTRVDGVWCGPSRTYDPGSVPAVMFTHRAPRK